MKTLFKYLKLIAGSFLIAFAFNCIILQDGLMPSGVEGIAFLTKDLFSIHTSIIILVINAIIIISSYPSNKTNASKYIIPSILIPIMIYITEFIPIKLEMPEELLTIITGGVLIGLGYTLIYKSGFKAGCIYLLEEDIGDAFKYYTKVYTHLINVIIVLMYMFVSFELAVYSIFMIIIIEYMVNKARFNINDSKMFFVITTKEKEVRKYIIETLGYELTVLDVKGGFSLRKKSILLSVISAKDYYKLKTSIMEIDDKAFVSITDTYDVINRKDFNEKA